MAQERDSGGLRAFGWLTEARVEMTKRYEKRPWSAAFFGLMIFWVLLLGYWFGLVVQ